MRILMLTPYLPFPLTSGGQTRSYNLIKHLSKNHEITLFSLIKDEDEKKFIPELKKYCKKVEVFKRSKSAWTARNITLTGFGPYPFLVIRNLSPQERSAVKNELSTSTYDLIHAETFYVMPHIPKTSVPILLVEQTIEYMVYKHYVEDQAPLFIRPLLWIDVIKLRFWETHFWKKANKVVAMSDSDRKDMLKLSPNLGIDVVPNGVDVEFFAKKLRKPLQPPRVLYVGNFTWLQNEEAVEALVRRVWPKIKKEIPTARLWVVGKNVTPRIRSFESKDIEITEGMPDIRDAYSQATVLVTPIKGPGGTRLKILEAMASGLPVVTTSVGAEGLGVTHGKEAFISDDFEKLSDLAVGVIKDSKIATELGESGRMFVQRKYSWEKNARLLEKIYEDLRKDERN